MIQHGLMMLNVKDVAITCLVRLPCLPTSSKSQRCAPSRLDAPVTLLSSASRAKGQLLVTVPLWKLIVNYCCIRLILDYIRLYMMLYYCCTCDIIASFSYILIVDHSPIKSDGDAGIMMVAVLVVLVVVHIETCLTPPSRLQDGGYDGASRPGFRSCFGMCWIWCACFNLPYDHIDYITHVLRSARWEWLIKYDTVLYVNHQLASLALQPSCSSFVQRFLTLLVKLLQTCSLPQPQSDLVSAAPIVNASSFEDSYTWGCGMPACALVG